MKKMKIYLQYPWKFPDSPYYKYLIVTPPKNIEYINVRLQRGAMTNYMKFIMSNKLKIQIRKIIRVFKIPLLNAHLTKTKQKYDLIHCAHCLSLNENKPWVIDIEGNWQFYFDHESPKLKEKAKKILASENCKKILAWTNDAKKNILREFPDIKGKIGLVYPAMPLPKIKRKKHKGINMLYAARYFYGKGGLHALEAIDRLTKKQKDVKGIFVSADIPKKIKERYSENSRIEFYDIIPQKKLFEEILPKSDIFLYPGYRDSFGFAMVEAMSFGIPVITVNGFARKEIVEDKKTGFVLDFGRQIQKHEMRKHNEEIVNEITKKTEILINDKNLRKKMSRNCIEVIKNGRFSIKERNKKLKRIYEDALK